MPHYQALTNEYADADDVVFLAVSQDQGTRPVLDYLKENDFTFAVALDEPRRTTGRCTGESRSFAAPRSDSFCQHGRDRPGRTSEVRMKVSRISAGNSPVSPGVAARLKLAVILGASGGLMNTTLALLGTPPLLDRVQFATLVALAGAVPFLVAGVIAAWIPVGDAGTRRTAYALAVHSTFLYAAAVWALTPSFEDLSRSQSVAIAAFGVSLLAFVGIGTFMLTAHSAAAERIAHWAPTWISWSPIGIALAGVFFWSEVYHPSGLAKSALRLIILGVLGVAARLVVGRRAKPRSFVLWPTATVVLLLIGPQVPSPTTPNADARGGGPAPTGPSILLLTVDTLRADVLSALSPRGVPTPDLDRLIEESVSFRNARSPAPWTRPAMVSMLTGTSPLVHGSVGWSDVVPKRLPMLAEILADHGYRTAAIVQNPFLHPAYGFARGFQHFSHYPLPLDSGAAIGTLLIDRLGWYPRGERTGADMVEEAIGWLREPRDAPFFLWLHLFDPHVPYQPPVEYLQNAPAATASVGARFDDLLEIRDGRFAPTPADRERIEALYRGEVAYVDAQIGRLIGALKTAGLYDEMLIVFSADHGEEFWEHGSFEHGHTLYSELLRVPLSFKLPGGHLSGILDEAVSTEAVAQTILGVAGIGPVHADARIWASLQPLWDDREDSVELPPIIATGPIYGPDRIAIITSQMKLIRDLSFGTERLFDLRADPAERHALDPESPAGMALLHQLENATERAATIRTELDIDVATIGFDAATRKQLRGLGYVR